MGDAGAYKRVKANPVLWRPGYKFCEFPSQKETKIFRIPFVVIPEHTNLFANIAANRNRLQYNLKALCVITREINRGKIFT